MSVNTAQKIGNTEFITSNAQISRGIIFAGIPKGIWRAYSNSVSTSWALTAGNNVSNITNNNSTYKILDSLVTVNLQLSFVPTIAQTTVTFDNLPLPVALIDEIKFTNFINAYNQDEDEYYNCYSTVDAISSETQFTITLQQGVAPPLNFVPNNTYTLNGIIQYLTEEKTL